MNDTATLDRRSDITAKDRELIGELADVIVPAGAGFPSASEAAVHTKWIDRGVKARPDLYEPLMGLARLCAHEPAAEVIDRLVQEDPEFIEPVIELVLACYYMAPKVRKLLGYRGQTATPILPGETDYYLRDDVLAPVAGRPTLWRDVETETNKELH